MQSSPCPRDPEADVLRASATRVRQRACGFSACCDAQTRRATARQLRIMRPILSITADAVVEKNCCSLSPGGRETTAVDQGHFTQMNLHVPIYNFSKPPRILHRLVSPPGSSR